MCGPLIWFYGLTGGFWSLVGEVFGALTYGLAASDAYYLGREIMDTKRRAKQRKSLVAMGRSETLEARP